MQRKETSDRPTGGDNLNQAGSYKSSCDGLAWKRRRNDDDDDDQDDDEITERGAGVINCLTS